MLDLAKYIKGDNSSASELEAFVFEDHGVPSVEFLLSILEPNSKLHQLGGSSRMSFSDPFNDSPTDARSTVDNQFFLLQNWWAEKQFVEVDLSYLAGTGATLSFIITPQMGIPSNFTSDYLSYHESSLDKQERHVIERS